MRAATGIPITASFYYANCLTAKYFSTPDDAAQASAHFRTISAGDLSDLVEYVESFDTQDIPQPFVTVRRGSVISMGTTDDVTFPDATITYQWYEVTPSKALVEIADAMGPSLTLSNLALPDSGEYVCVVSDANESMLGPTFQLIVLTTVPLEAEWGMAVLAALLAVIGLRRLRRDRPALRRS